ncbi:MAG: hypothetical protein ACRCTE_01055 [Cellulosilyticaceae bacterium]
MINTRLQELMTLHEINFDTLSRELNVGKRTLTRKFKGETDWTYQEMMILAELFEIEDVEAFFFG